LVGIASLESEAGKVPCLIDSLSQLQESLEAENAIERLRSVAECVIATATERSRAYVEAVQDDAHSRAAGFSSKRMEHKPMSEPGASTLGATSPSAS
jgi:hypothetical protein